MAFVMWNWTSVDPADCILPCASDSDGNASPLNDIDLTSDETGSDEPIMDEEVPTITHSVVFKCIGSHKEHRYQELLTLANKKVKDGSTQGRRNRSGRPGKCRTKILKLQFTITS